MALTSIWIRVRGLARKLARMSSLPTPLNLRPPIQDAVVTASNFLLTTVWQNFFTNLNRTIVDLATFNPDDYGATGNGISDDTKAIQAAINAVIAAGGGILQFDGGTFSMTSVSTPASTVPIFIQGQGAATILLRRSTLTAGIGMLDIRGSNVSVQNLTFDGNTLTPVGLQYGVDFNGIGGNDPMAASLTTNTSVWIHGGTSNLSFYLVRFQHAGGYSILADATLASIDDIHIERCQFFNNRPTLFGTAPSQLIYGSWNGGIFLKGDGRTIGSGSVTNVLVSFCHFSRNTGNCLWSHSYGFAQFNEDFRFIGNYFQDCGLDGILCGAVSGGVVDSNVFRRIGYICSSDTSPAIPRWLNDLNATGIDSSGIVKGVPYTNNSFLSVNGGCMDLDGHGDSVIANNVCRIPYPTEPEYAEDSIAISGPLDSGSFGYGVNMGNTSQTPFGGVNVNINGNSFINLPGGALRMYSARYCSARDNLIVSPDAPMVPPISFGPVGPGAYQRCYNLKISGNTIYYSPSMSAPAVYEDDTYSAFLSTEQNFVYDNFPIGTTGLAFEFQKSTHSGSFVSSIFPPSQNYITTEDGANGAIACPAGSGAKLTNGLTISVLLAHTLAGGGTNTLAYNGGPPVGIKSHLNAANNIANGYAIGSVITLLYDGTQWQDQSQ